jgi:TPR repeat protein
MNVRITAAALFAAAFLGGTAAHADFQAALRDYQAGRYDAAHSQFLALAELGDCSSQFNLGAMALKGQGGPKDTASGVGWLEAAAGNGCERLVGNHVATLSAKLTPEESRTAAAIVARYGPEALHAQGIVNPDFTCRDLDPATVVSAPVAEYPSELHGPRQEAVVITALTIGTDGRARDPEVLLSVPRPEFAAAAVEAWMNSLFTPAHRGGQPVVSRLQAKTLFAIEGQTLADAQPYKVARTAADAGDLAAQYLVGVTATLDSSLGISYARAGQLLLGAARDGDAAAQYWVGSQLRATSTCHSQADGTVWLRHAADGGSASAQLVLAGDLLNTAPAAAQAEQARALLEKAAASDSYYVRKHVTALLAASPLDAVRDPPTALGVAMKLAAGEIQSDPQMFEVVAAAYAANGDFHNAVAQQQLALRKAEALGWNTSAMDERLSAYRHGKPWRGDLFALP